jgi:hypothetical protein
MQSTQPPYVSQTQSCRGVFNSRRHPGLQTGRYIHSNIIFRIYVAETVLNVLPN